MSFSPPVPPLTFDNILKIVKNLRRWHILDHCHYFSPNLTAIQHQHCVSVTIEKFLSGKGDEQPTWRALIWSLFQSNEIQLAEQIRSFAEPLQGMGRYNYVTN